MDERTRDATKDEPSAQYPFFTVNCFIPNDDEGKDSVDEKHHIIIISLSSLTD